MIESIGVKEDLVGLAHGSMKADTSYGKQLGR